MALNPKIKLRHIVAKFGSPRFKVSEILIFKLTDRWTDRWTDSQGYMDLAVNVDLGLKPIYPLGRVEKIQINYAVTQLYID